MILQLDLIYQTCDLNHDNEITLKKANKIQISIPNQYNIKGWK